MGTGDRAEAVPEGARDGADIGPDRIARSKDALDSAESITGNDDAIESLADDDDGGSDEDDDDDDRLSARLAAVRPSAGASTSCARRRATSAERRLAIRPTISKPNPGSGSRAGARCSGRC